MEQLDREQQQVLSVRAGACWVIAGPGTGKTATLVAKTTALIQAGERPLVVTYTRGAAAEMKKRMGPLRDQACLSTCHALALRILGRLSALLPRPRRLLSATEKATLLRTVRKRCRSELTEGELEEHLARVKACGATTEEEHVLLQVYESEKGPGRMDFQDLLIDTTALLQHAPPWRAIYQAMYTHLVVDEAQDLDPLQAAFLA